jgi:hypothetical protein
MPKYRIELEDGREFDVEADAPPTEADLLTFLSQQSSPQGLHAAAAGAETIGGAPWYAKPVLGGPSVLQALNTLPAVGGMLGGAVASPGIVTAAGGAALGGAGGEALRQLGRRALGASAPETPARAAQDIAGEAAIQGGAQLVGRVAGKALTSGAGALMQSAVKPTLKMAPNTPKIVKVLLDEGINVSPRGLEKLNRLLDAKNEEIAAAIKGSHGLISKASVAQRTAPLAKRLSEQVNPTKDLAAVEAGTQEFLEGATHLTVPQAQAIKTGTYQQIRKNYGQLSSAAVETQKALARGLKEEIAKEVPSIAGLNAQESSLILAKEALGRRVAMSGNRDPVGFAWVTNHPTTFLAALIDRSPAVKSMLARGMYSSAGAAAKVSPQLIRAAVIALSTSEDASPETASAPAP